MRGLDVLGLVSVAITTGGCFGLGFAAGRAIPAETPMVGLRGLKRLRAQENTPFWGLIDPLVRWLTPRIQGLISPQQRESLGKDLKLAGDYMGLSPDEFIALDVLSGIGGFLVANLMLSVLNGGAITVIGITAMCVVSPWMTLGDVAKRRQSEVARRLPGIIDLMVLGMGAGLDFPGAVRQIVEKSSSNDDAVIEEFQLMLQMLQLGRTRIEALRQFADRVPHPAVREFVGAVTQSEERGNPVVTALRIQAEVSRQRRSTAAEEAASKAGVAMVAPLLLLFICIVLIIVGPIALGVKNAGL
jgi:tight adherence protein C